MSLTFPRKFTHGQKLGNVDVYGELFLWPDGHFQYMVHRRSNDPFDRACINATFVLFDEKQMPLGTYGMPADDAWSAGGGRRYDELYGRVPEDKLKRTAAAALLFRTQNQEWDAATLRDLATAGSELVFCPTPD